ncbi:MAG: sulfatase, partial [Anaerolineae bacterium]|nr:sulfatase [Anaerolineae bacterium]
RIGQMRDHSIVLIVVDCLRADQLRCYGADGTVAPNIERLAGQGVLFEQAIAQGHATWTTMPTILSGTYPSMYGGHERFSKKRPRLATILKTLGFQTAAFAPNPYLSEARGYRAGFDHFDECIPKLSRRRNSAASLLVRGFNQLFGRWGLGIECPPYLDAKRVTERAADWLRGINGHFFLWLHYMDVHMPYDLDRCALLLPGGKGRRPYEYGFWRRYVRSPAHVTQKELAVARQLYRDGLASVDRQIGFLLDVLRDLGHLEQTSVVVTADHGEAFGEHGTCGHQAYLYEESIHVPLIVAPRGAVQPQRISAQVRHLDLAPTLIEWAGGVPPREMQGVSLLPSLEGAPQTESLPAISQTSPRNEWRLSLRQPPWKFIWHLDLETMLTLGIELYHLVKDPGERNNVANQYPEQAARMQSRLKEHIANLDLKGHGEPFVEGTDPAVLERLRALGYFDGP